MSEEKVKFTGRDLAEAMGAARRHFNASRAEVAYEMVGEAKVGPETVDLGCRPRALADRRLAGTLE